MAGIGSGFQKLVIQNVNANEFKLFDEKMRELALLVGKRADELRTFGFFFTAYHLRLIKFTIFVRRMFDQSHWWALTLLISV